MSTYTVHFLPADRTVTVDDGTTVAEAAQQGRCVYHQSLWW
jgi:hypothetical protein